MPNLRRLDPPTLRAAWWAFRASRHARQQLETRPLESAMAGLPPVPRLPERAGRGVDAALRMRREKCLVQAIVRQAWEAAHDRPRELVIGVAPLEGGQLRAHAWLEGDADLGFQELLRRGAPPRT